MLSIIREAIDLLPTLRADSAQWARCAYEEVVHPEFGKQDRNELERHRFLIALQYERLPDDESLVRELFDQEVIARRRDDFQGFGEPLEIASYLLSRWKRRSDFWRFAEAKCANFDTACGYDTRFLFAAGRDAALAEFANSEHELKEQIQDDLFDDDGACRFASEEIDAWEQELIAEYSKRPQDEPSIVWIDRAITFQLHEEGRALLRRYETSQTDESLRSLSYMQKNLGDLKGAVETRRKILALARNDWNRVSDACSLAEALCEDDRADEAWTAIRECDESLDRIEGWNEVGLGRNIVELAFRIAKSASSDLAQAAFAWGCFRHARLKTSSLRLLTLAAGAAVLLGDSAKAERFDDAARAEQVRIDEMLKK